MTDPDDVEDLNRIGLESIAAHLRSQGLSPLIVDDRVTVVASETNLTCRCSVLATSPGTHQAIVPVAIKLSYACPDVPLDERSVHKIAVGLSEERTEAVVQATHTWCTGVLPPLRRVFDPLPPSAEDDDSAYPFQVATQNMETGAVTQWDLFLGYAQVGGQSKSAFTDFIAEAKIVHLLLNALTSVA